jgi:hypothetical protein
MIILYTIQGSISYQYNSISDKRSLAKPLMQGRKRSQICHLFLTKFWKIMVDTDKRNENISPPDYCGNSSFDM